MTHKLEDIVDRADGRADAACIARADALIADSPRLASFHEWLTSTLPLFQAGPLPTLSADAHLSLMDWFLGEYGFAQDLDLSEPEPMTCVSDSSTEAQPVGLRRGGGGDRRLALKGGGFSLVMQSHRGSGGEPGQLVGRIAGDESAGVIVTLVAGGEKEVSEHTDDSGRFYFQSVPSSVEVTMTLKDPLDVARSATFQFNN